MNINDKDVTLSILIPTFKRQTSLISILSQILEQDIKFETEIIVSDNYPEQIIEEALLEILIEGRIRYIRQDKNIGLIENAKFLRAQARGKYHCLIHDDDKISSKYFENLVRVLEKNPSAVIAMPIGERTFEGVYWYQYEKYENLNLPSVDVIRDFIERMRGSIWSIEHLYYAVYRSTIDTSLLDCGRPSAIYAHLVKSFLSGKTVYSHDSVFTKNTTLPDLVKYSEADYFRKTFLDNLGRKLSLKLQSRFLLMRTLFIVIMLHKDISIYDRLRLLLVLLRVQIHRPANKTWVTPKLSAKNFCDLEIPSHIKSSYFQD